MRVILLILAAYAFVGWNDADAACQRFKPDGACAGPLDREVRRLVGNATVNLKKR